MNNKAILELTIRDLALYNFSRGYKLIINSLPLHTRRYLTRKKKKNSNIRYTRNKVSILVHPSARLSAFSTKIGTGILICTKYDSSRLSYRKHVDKIITAQENYKDLIPEDAINYFESQEEFESAKEYVNLVLQFFFNGDDYELLYNSEGIKYILDSIL